MDTIAVATDDLYDIIRGDAAEIQDGILHTMKKGQDVHAVAAYYRVPVSNPRRTGPQLRLYADGA